LAIYTCQPDNEDGAALQAAPAEARQRRNGRERKQEGGAELQRPKANSLTQSSASFNTSPRVGEVRAVT